MRPNVEKYATQPANEEIVHLHAAEPDLAPGDWAKLEKLEAAILKQNWHQRCDCDDPSLDNGRRKYACSSGRTCQMPP